MWRANAGHNLSVKEDSDDDWDTEADYENKDDDDATRKAARTFGDATTNNVVKEIEYIF
jgi:hypothetical protein